MNLKTASIALAKELSSKKFPHKNRNAFLSCFLSIGTISDFLTSLENQQKIETEQEAKEMISEICKWLERGAPGNTVEKPYESAQAELARDFSQELLFCAGVKGIDGGCALCQE